MFNYLVFLISSIIIMQFGNTVLWTTMQLLLNELFVIWFSFELKLISKNYNVVKKNRFPIFVSIDFQEDICPQGCSSLRKDF